MISVLTMKDSFMFCNPDLADEIKRKLFHNEEIDEEAWELVKH